MNRRHFLGQALLAPVVFSSHVRPAAAQGGGLQVKFVGMMGFIPRSDRSLLVALPGHHRLGHYTHVPFLMARTGSAIAGALGCTRMPGVVAGAFDMSLADAAPDSFVFRCLDGLDLDIRSAGSKLAVDNQASHMAQMHRIVPGKRLRGNLRRWSHAAITLAGGQLSNSAGHPDAGKIWSFGDYQQPLTDAVTFSTSAATVRLENSHDVISYEADASQLSELWVVSAGGFRIDQPDPKRLEHASVLFDFFADATPVIPYCPTAEGRITFATEMPCAAPSIASLTGGAARAFPPVFDLCFNGFFGPE